MSVRAQARTLWASPLRLSADKGRLDVTVFTYYKARCAF